MYIRTPISQKQSLYLSNQLRVKRRQEKILKFFQNNPDRWYSVDDINKLVFNNKINPQRMRFYLNGMLHELARKRKGNKFIFKLINNEKI